MANLSYWYHMINFLRPFAFKKNRRNTNSVIMYKSYLKSGLRNFRKHKLSSFINIFGLGTTIAIAIVVYVMIDREFSLDKFHKDAEKVFAVQSRISWNGSEETWGRTPVTIGPSLKADYPQVQQQVRVNVKSATVRFGDRVFNERVTLADPEYLEMFNFPIVVGSKESLRNKSEVILSQDMVKKYFGDSDPIGQDVRLIINDKAHLMTVAGIASKFPVNASFEFDFLVNFQNLENMYGTDLNAITNIQNQSVFTFIKLDEPANISFLKEATAKYLNTLNDANRDWPIENFMFHPLPTLARNSQYIREVYASGSTPEIMIMFGVVSLILLVSACFNYVNIAVSMAQKRLNEIALRKVVGGQRKQLITQFLTENMVLCFAASVIGFFVATYLLVPGINSLFQGASYEISLIDNPGLSVFIFALFSLVGLASGAYPAFYISSFRPVIILKGKEKLTSKNRLTKIFLSSQFLLTFLAIVSGLLFTNMNETQENQSWGYTPDDIVVVPVQDVEQFDMMRSVVEQSPRVVGFSGSSAQVGLSSAQEVIRILNEKFTVRSFGVGANYFETMQMELAQGRGFDPKLTTDRESSIIVNEEFIKKMPIDEAGGDYIEIDGSGYRIVGVVKNFHFDDFFSPITPAIFKLIEDSEFNYLSVKTIAGGGREMEEIIETAWKNQFPDTPYAGFLQKDVFDSFFKSTGALRRIMNFVAIVAIILSSMGLFGLVSLLIVKKLKEYSIRKVLGAHSGHVVRLILGQFLLLLVVALAIGLPVSYLFYNVLFEQMFPGTIGGMTVAPFIISVLILVAVIVITTLSHILQLIRMNPVNSLRMEN